MAKGPFAPWEGLIDFKPSAVREFLRLPPDVRELFLKSFGEFSKYPQKRTPTLDVAPIRNDPSHWRLKVVGDYRGVYRMVQGRPKFEMFQSQQDVYEALRRYLTSVP